MNITLYLSVKERERSLREALIKGFERHGDKVRSMLRKEFGTDTAASTDDMAIFVGVKSLRIWKQCMASGRQVMIIDKGYFGRADYSRMSINGFQPPYLDKMGYDSTRLNRLSVVLKPKSIGGNTVIYAGSSAKYCDFHELGDVTAYAHKVCADLMPHLGDRLRLIYRPKPSWWANEDTDVAKTVPEGARLSPPTENFAPLLRSAHCVVTHGSNAAIEALAAGVPVLLTSGPGISAVHELCEHSVHNLQRPFWPSEAERQKKMNNLAWCQFNVNEIANGFAWEHLKRWSRPNS